MVERKPLSLESAKRIYKNLGQDIEQYSAELDLLHNIKATLPKNEQSLSDIISLHMHVFFILLDLSAAYRIYFSALIPHEERFAIQQLNVIMVEGYKRLYGFNSIIKESLFYKVNPLRNKITSTDVDGYNKVEQELIEFGNGSNLDKDARDNSVHYNTDVMKVYDMLVSIDAEKTSQNVISCLAVLKSLNLFLGSVEKRFFNQIKESTIH